MIFPAPKPRPRAQRERFSHRRDPAFTGWVRSLPCLLRGEHVCWGPVQVCHVKSRGAGGVDHGNVVPMCAGAHDEQGRGIQSFERKHGLDLRLEAARYHLRYVREIAWRTK